MFATLTATLRRQGKFFHLLVVQVLLLALFPYLNRPGIPSLIFRSLAVTAFLTGVYAFTEKRAHYITAVALAVLTIVPTIMLTLRRDPRFAGPALLCIFIFHAFTLASLLRAVLLMMEVTHDTVYGSLSVYLLMAMT